MPDKTINQRVLPKPEPMIYEIGGVSFAEDWRKVKAHFHQAVIALLDAL